MKVPLKRYWFLLSRYLQHRKWQFIFLAFLLLGGIGLQIYIPQITRRFIDLAKSGSVHSVLIRAAIGFIAASLVHQGVSVLARYVGETIAWSATNDLRIDLARHCLHLDMSFHNDKSPGELIERIDGDLLQISMFFSQLVVMVLGSVLLFIGILVVLSFENIKIGTAFAGFSIATLIAFIRLRNIAVPYDKAEREKLSEIFGYIEERLSGTEDVRSSGAVEYVLLGLYRLHYEMLKISRKAQSMHVIIQLVAGLSMSIGYGMAIIFGYNLYKSGELTIGGVYLVIHYTELLAWPIRTLSREFQSLQTVGANVERINDLFSITSKIEGAGDSQHVMPAQGPISLSFQHVSFAYSPDKPVLKNLSFSLDSGKTLGVLGRTGSGKTTLARLLFRLYDTDSGAISLGEQNIKDFPLRSLRNRVAMVTQDVQLFQATIRENLTFFDSSVDDQKLINSIKQLGLEDWFKTLPDGLDSMLDLSGKSLSAGEAQLLAFTRVFLRNPNLVILDEASSRLDPVTEKLIEQAIDKLLVDRTAIIIAHRLRTIGKVQDILILKNGEIVEMGNRIELSRNPVSLYHGLLKTGLEEVLS